MRPYRAGEARRVQLGGGKRVAPRPLDLAAALGGAIDHADHGEAGKCDLARVAPVGEQPADVAADRVAADRVAADRVAADRVAADRVAADRVAADRVAAD